MVSYMKIISACGFLLFSLSVITLGCQLQETGNAKNERLMAAQKRLLANPQDNEALSVVLEMLRSDPSIVARSNAAATLGTVGAKHGEAIKARAIPALIYALDKDSMSAPDSAARALVKFGPLAKDAIPVLRKRLTPSDTSIAWSSAEALGAIGPEAREAVPDLLRVIKDNQETYLNDSVHICGLSTEALGEIKPPAQEVIPELKSLLTHRNPYFRARLSVAMIRIDPANQDALKELKSLLADQDVQVRRRTIWSLKDIGSEAKPAESLIRAATTDTDESVRNSAAESLRGLATAK
jgi:HEAT repeat protein